MALYECACCGRSAGAASGVCRERRERALQSNSMMSSISFGSQERSHRNI